METPSRNRQIVYLWLVCTFLVAISCKNTKQSNEAPVASNLSGKQLAQTYCASCHAFPAPNLLDKQTWQNGVLPKMYARLGLEEDSFKLFGEMSNDDMMTIIRANIYPDQPTIAKADWEKIVKYYLENAPEKPLPQAKKAEIKTGLPIFKIRKLINKADNIPAITLVKFNQSDNSILIGKRGQKNVLETYSTKFLLKDTMALNRPIADIHNKNNDLIWLEMGLMDPNDQKRGVLRKLSAKTISPNTVQDSLQRPVNISFGDLNQDNSEDYLICNFGNELGNVTWYDGKTNTPHVLNETPGARIAYIRDLNNDGLNDIAVLMTQANEQIIYYVNKGKGNFEAKTVLRFPPVYGSSYFELVDFNQDGQLDILYTNGDNADLSIALKNYHGLRIFTNIGKDSFKETYFYPMYGASKAMAADFDLDGDLDIAAISFFPDPNQKPNEGFLFFKNTQNGFEINTTLETKTGKWMTMDLGDMDDDGDTDIIIGSFKIKEKRPELNAKREVDAIILENKTK